MKDYRKWLGEKQDFLIPLSVVLLIGILPMLGMFVGGEAADQDVVPDNRVEVLRRGGSKEGSQTISGGVVASYFLKPSANEVFDLMRSSGDAVLPPANQKYTGLRVMWPAYFFKVTDDSSARVKVLLDNDKSGFGVVFETEIDSLLHPEILSMSLGQKLWIAGEIKEVDVTGTGTIYIEAEEVRFEEELMEAIGRHDTSQARG